MVGSHLVNSIVGKARPQKKKVGGGKERERRYVDGRFDLSEREKPPGVTVVTSLARVIMRFAVARFSVLVRCFFSSTVVFPCPLSLPLPCANFGNAD